MKVNNQICLKIGQPSMIAAIGSELLSTLKNYSKMQVNSK